VPLVPQNLVYARGNRSVTLTFTAPYDGGSPITEYQVSTGGWTDLLTSVSGTTVTATVSGLPPGASVSMSVRAVNAAGPGAATDPILVAVVGSPNVPTGLAITPGDTKLALAFTPGAFTGSAETYQYSLDGGVWTDFPATASGSGQAGTISGLTNGRTYAVQVRGTDSWGDGDATAEVNGTPVAFAAARPGPPTAVTAVAHTSSLTVSWAAVDDSTLTGYTATATPGGATCTTDKATTSCLLGGTGGTSYTVTVVANTADSGSEPSDPSNAVVPDSPAVPASAPSGSSVAAPVVTDNGPLSTVSPGQGCVFVAQQFAPLSQVTAVMYSDPVVLGTGTTDADGNVSLSVTIPTGIAAGSHTIALIGVDADGNDRILASKVTAASTTTSPSPGPPAPNDNGTFLPTTGAGVLPLGLLLVVIGATLFLLSRRRGPAAE
jgi:titin